jgi:dihydrofolate reductase
VARLIYSAIASLDGYIEDEDGNFDWAVPDEEVHAFANDLLRPLGIYLYGRRMYETMAGWETDTTLAERSPLMRDSVSGPALAAHAFRAGLVEECHLFVAPILVGGGKRSLPDDVRVRLELLDERRFGGGMVYLHYRIRT